MRVHDVALVVDLERAGARVSECAAVVQDEEALPAQREVQAVVGEVDVALA